MTLIEQLTKFCATVHDCREYLRAPFAQGDFVYFTNGHVCARVPRALVTADESDKPANVSLMFDKLKHDGLAELLFIPEPSDCKWCHGTMKRSKCPDCDGKGEFNKGQWSYKCMECSGSGQVELDEELAEEPCYRCEGTGNQFNEWIMIGPSKFSVIYLSMISALPGVKFAPSTDANGCGYFTFDGGDGLIMPLKTYCDGELNA